MRILGMILGGLLVTSQVAVAQSDCAGFAKMVSERSTAAQKAEEALDKLRPGAPETCKLAKDFAQSTASLQKFIDDHRSLCNQGPIGDLAKSILNMDIAAMPLRLRAAEQHVLKCPR